MRAILFALIRMRCRFLIVTFVALFACGLVVCSLPAAVRSATVSADAIWDLPPGVPPPYVPDPSALTPARIALGRQLFYEQRLSINGTQSCGACHRRQFAFTDQRARALGATGELHPRGSMSLVNVAYRDTLTWADPAMTRLEEQALVPMFGEHPIELGLKGREAKVYAQLSDDVMYLRLFGEAYPGDPSPITTGHIVEAMGAFQRSIVSFRAPYDRYRFNRDEAAMSASALRGEALFFSAERTNCALCHRGLNFDGGARTAASGPLPPMFHNTGLFTRYADPNIGLQRHSRSPDDEGKFRAPTLRNIARTAPYMHDGSVATLGEVLDHYAAGGRAAHANRSPLLRPFTLTVAERADLLAFLESLTDVAALHDSRWGDPWQTKYDF
jgi:cytochrome c peroxidase